MSGILIGLADRTARFSFVSGGLVTATQQALNAAGHSVGEPDGVYGNDSATAMNAWQTANGRDDTGEVSLEEFAMLTGDTPDAFEISLQLTARFEGHGFSLAKGNFDGALITWGIIGFTMSNGELQNLITKIDATDPAAVTNSFGVLEAEFRHGLGLDPRGQAAKDWVAGISQAPGSANLLPAWKAGFEKLGETTAARQHQMARAREKYWQRAERDAATFGLQDLTGLALCFDIAVQNGGVSSAEAARISTQFAQAGNTLTDQKRREIVGTVVAEASNPRWVEDVRSRKMTIATGEGEVHSGKFRMRDWGLEALDGMPPVVLVAPLQPAAPPRTLDLKDRFDAFFGALSLRFFTPDEFRFLGASHSTPGKSGFGLNHLPGEDLWPNMVATVLVIERLRADLDAPIRLTNVFRSPAYNAAIGGATQSQHKFFTAVDFFCNNGQGPESWGRKLKEYRARGDFRGGVGIYVQNHFVHLDTRGVNVDFQP